MRTKEELSKEIDKLESKIEDLRIELNNLPMTGKWYECGLSRGTIVRRMFIINLDTNLYNAIDETGELVIHGWTSLSDIVDNYSSIKLVEEMRNEKGI